MIVDINEAASVPRTPQTAPALGGPKRPQFQHQASLTASATAAVGGAGKFLANKLAETEANLKGVLAAATHFTGGGSAGVTPKSRIKFQNLEGDDFDEEDNDDDNGDDEEEEEEEEDRTTNAADSTMDDEDEDSDFARRQRQKRNRRAQSVLSAALSSYKSSKQRAGYQQALDDEEEEEEEEDEDDDDVDEKMNLNRSASFKQRPAGADRKSLRPANKSHQTQQPGLASSTVSSSTDDTRQTPSSTPKGRLGSQRPKRAQQKCSERSKRRTTTGVKGGGRYEEEEDEEEDGEGGLKSYRCLDNSVALLLKSRLEETVLRVAVGAIMLVALGIFVVFSLPPAPPPKEVLDILIGQ